ncbi:MAG: hypothetical protein U0941_28315 [Planctomycetaceae bacterium]
MKPSSTFVLAAVLVVCRSSVLLAQVSPANRPDGGISAASSKPRSTFLEIKLLTSNDGGGLHAQQWSKMLEPLDVSIQIQRQTDEKTEVRERIVGTLRYVTAVGTLDRSGRINFPNRSFELGDGAKLREWVNELKTYGAQGTPDGQPMWGLSKEQFTTMYDALVKPAEAEYRDLLLTEAIAKLPLPKQYPVRFSQAALALVKQPGAKNRVRQEVKGFSAATALAIMLNDCKLGFRPNRTPAEGFELLVEPLGQKQALWAIGWPLQKQRFKAAPKFFAMTQIELDNVSLSDLLPTVSELTETPVMLDYYEIEEKNIDFPSLKVSVKRTQTSWSVALKSAVVSRKLSREIWQDEAGRAFVWITTVRPGRSGTSGE